MSEYHNDPSYGRDDYGSVCRWCGDWFEIEEDLFCSSDCETSADEHACTLCGMVGDCKQAIDVIAFKDNERACGECVEWFKKNPDKTPDALKGVL